MSEQLPHQAFNASIKKFPVVLLTDNLLGDANIGSLFRLADAFNIEKIVFTGTPANLSSNRLKRTARATIKDVEHTYVEDPVKVLQKLINEGYTPIALEITNDSIAVENFDFQPLHKIALIAGNERHGVSTELLNLVTHNIHITMFGRNSSMNVAQATGIALYEITKTLPPLQEK